jgi:inorganic pyrophosphatase
MPTTEHKLQDHVSFQGLPIAIENRKGSVRSGVDKDGTPWHTKMLLPYGYFKNSKGHDGEELDVFVGPDKKAPNAYVVHQKKDDGSFDEHKVLVGVGSKEEAKKKYLAHYDTKKYLGPIQEMPMEKLKEHISSGKKLEKLSEVVQWAFLEELGRIQQAWSSR